MSPDAPAEALRLLHGSLDQSDEPERSPRRAEILAEVGDALSESLDYLVTLPQLASVLVPRLADWCSIAVLDEHDAFRRIAVVHRDPACAVAARSLLVASGGQLVDALSADGPVLRSGLTDADLVAISDDPRHQILLRELGMRACIIVPIIARGVPLGVLLLVLSDEARSFGPGELELAQEIARRAAISVDNARLLRDAERRHASEQVAREQAEAASRTKDEFLATLAHELRDPLSPVVTALELMKWKGDGGVKREREVIERQITHLVQLVDDVTEVSRLARGKLALRKTVCGLQHVIDAAFDRVAPGLASRGQRLDLDIAPGLAVHADVVRLARLVGSMLSNASDRTSPDARIRVTARCEAGWIVVSVSDEGCAGLGSALTLARALAILHGGSLVARSLGADRGREIDLRLPAAEPEKMVAQLTEDASQAALPTARSPRRVLVVDDNVDSAELVAEFLRTVGHEVAVAHDGPSALEIAATLRPEVAILDIGLPIMDGYELAARLAEQHGSATPRLIALTGYGQDHDCERTRRAGFASHCVKPIDARRLLGVIDEV